MVRNTGLGNNSRLTVGFGLPFLGPSSQSCHLGLGEVHHQPAPCEWIPAPHFPTDKWESRRRVHLPEVAFKEKGLVLDS
jgi:hypothetical protein